MHSAIDFDVAIVGGGFSGIYAAWRLSRAGRRVILLEAGDHLGGSMWSVAWNGFLVDPGAHNLDLRDDAGAEFYTDILGDNIAFLDGPNWASVTGRTLSHGFEMPDFWDDEPEFCATALAELRDMARVPAAGTGTPASFEALLLERFGPTLGSRLAAIVPKVVDAPPGHLAPEAATALGMFGRAKLGSDAQMIALKEASTFHDARLGVSLHSGDVRFAGLSRNFRVGYPATGAMRAFCIAAERRLRDLGTDVRTAEQVAALRHEPGHVLLDTGSGPVRARHLFWTLGDHALARLLGIPADPAAAAHPVGSAFHVFEVPAAAVTGPGFLHDFGTDRLPYRYNAAGLYGGQISPRGTTYVMAEVPAHPSRLATRIGPDAADTAWQALLDVGFVEPGTRWAARMDIGYPVAFTLPLRGWQAEVGRLAAAFASAAPRVVTIGFGYRGRKAFMQSFAGNLEPRLIE